MALERTQVSAACIDSCITSPICPVMAKLPLPFILLASMKRMSPPAAVQARPTATPGRLTRSATSVSTRTRMPPRNSLSTSRVTISFSFLPSTTRRACLRQTVPSAPSGRPSPLAHPGLPRVVAHDVEHRILGKLDLLWGNAVLLDLAGNQVAEGDVLLLVFAVALQKDQLHAVQQRRRNRVQLVGSADEQGLRQVERHVKIVVSEGVVLLRVQRFQQCGGRITAEVPSQLVNLVQHHHRVVGFSSANALDNLAGKRANIGAAMAANLRLVVHPAQRDTLQPAADG